jgi:hypothetical protein
VRDELARREAVHRLPRDLASKVRTVLAEQPALPCDAAVALVLDLG